MARQSSTLLCFLARSVLLLILLPASQNYVLGQQREEQASGSSAAKVKRSPPKLQSKPAGSMSPTRLSAYNNYDDYSLYTKGYHYDDADGTYFNSKTGMLDDVYGDYFFAAPEDRSSCKLDSKGKVALNGVYKKMCDIQLTGANEHVPLMTGGLDGIYKVHTCENGRPAFKRQNSPPGEERLLWYSTKHKDWDFSNGTRPEEMDILLYGGEGQADLRPEFVAKDKWFIAADFQTDKNTTVDYFQADVKVHCTSTKKAVPAPQRPQAQERPYMTEEEMENQYRSVMNPTARQRREEVRTSRSRATIVVLVIAAVVLLICIPRCLTTRHADKRRRGDAKGGWIGLTQLGSSRIAED